MFDRPVRRRHRLLAASLAIVVLLGVLAAFSVFSTNSSPFLGISSGHHVDIVEGHGSPAAFAAVGGAGQQQRSVNRVVLPDTSYGVVATIPLPALSDPVDVAADTNNGELYITDHNTSDVSVISGTSEKVVATITLATLPSGVIFDSHNSEVYVSTFMGDTVIVVNTTTNTVMKTIPVDGAPVGLASDPVKGYVYVTDQYANNTTVINDTTNTVMGSPIRVGTDPIAAAFDDSTGNVYVANLLSSNVSVIDPASNTVTATIAVGSYPLALAYDSGNTYIYVDNEISNNTTVISGATEKVVTSITTNPYPVGTAYDASLSIVAVASGERVGLVDIISSATNTLIATVAVGSVPVGMTYDASNGYIYVTNANSNNVSVIGSAQPAPNPVSFTESGLPAATSWSVTLNGAPMSSMTDTIDFSEAYGTYLYTIPPAAGLNATPSSGSVTVAGFPVSVSVAFAPFVYGVTFQETGLPTDTLWAVTLNITPASSNTSSITFVVANGTYPYSVTAPTGYTASPTSSSVTVKGPTGPISVTFSPTGKSSSSSTSSGLAWWVYAVIIVVVVVAVVGVVLILRQRRRPPATASTAPPRAGPPGTS